ncbi:Phosphatidylinositol phospholipase c [Neofusicoccum parvum]|uniref:Phosphatidylinositol phospholipase c n=1 Tax=Neofusicoccum parvum TaxID=310453 RepID=A0ACB5RRL8_9PEZI|nr:Phosphatidylinositol phospholipase c [Neofusicoccum parvum]
MSLSASPAPMPPTAAAPPPSSPPPAPSTSAPSSAARSPASPLSARGPTPSAKTPSSPLLRLPPELRHLIYDALTPPTTLSYPLGPNTAVSALSHAPPPRALLLTCRLLAAEALDHFYRVACFRVMLNPPAPLADPHFQRLAHLPQLRRIRNLGVLLDWDFPRLPGYAAAAGAGGFEFGLEAGETSMFRRVMDRGRCADMLRLAKRLVGVLEGAREVRLVTVSWTDLVEGCWEDKKGVLEVLRGALEARGVKVVKGDVVASDEEMVERLFEGWEVEKCRRMFIGGVERDW